MVSVFVIKLELRFCLERFVVGDLGPQFEPCLGQNNKSR